MIIERMFKGHMLVRTVSNVMASYEEILIISFLLVVTVSIKVPSITLLKSLKKSKLLHERRNLLSQNNISTESKRESLLYMSL